MKTITRTAVLAAGLAAALLAPAAVRAHCGHCGMGDEKKSEAVQKHECKGNCPMHSAKCPAKVEGAQVKVTDSAEGVTIVITAKDIDSVKKIQEAAKMMAEGKCCDGHGGHKEGRKDKSKKK